jgi:hypothetical protein
MLKIVYHGIVSKVETPTENIKVGTGSITIPQTPSVTITDGNNEYKFRVPRDQIKDIVGHRVNIIFEIEE